ncbi:MAG: hypothetical protein IJC89_00715, partial [Clostridia bacterium]|nr:hypothetical protein [Clostridia bacterium]
VSAEIDSRTASSALTEITPVKQETIRQSVVKILIILFVFIMFVLSLNLIVFTVYVEKQRFLQILAET